jgi:hypothetical protein
MSKVETYNVSGTRDTLDKFAVLYQLLADMRASLKKKSTGYKLYVAHSYLCDESYAATCIAVMSHIWHTCMAVMFHIQHTSTAVMGISSTHVPLMNHI